MASDEALTTTSLLRSPLVLAAGLVGASIVVAGIVLVFFGVPRDPATIEIVLPAETPAPAPGATSPKTTVYVSGAVARPGVYRCETATASRRPCALPAAPRTGLT